MPPKARVTRDMIVDAGFAIVREDGWESLSVRNVAGRLGCSTQPVMYNFDTVEALLKAVYARAEAFRLSYVMPEGSGDRSPVAWGVDHIQFAAREGNVFRFLYQSGRFDARVTRTPEEKSVLRTLGRDKSVGPELADAVFLRLFVASHGMASLVANGALDYDEKKCVQYLEGILRGLKGPEKKKEASDKEEAKAGRAKGKNKEKAKGKDKDKKSKKKK